MARRLEQAADGSVIEWMTHVFSNAMRQCDLPQLELEPCLRGADEVTAHCLVLSEGRDGVGWQWDPWHTVGVTFASSPPRKQALYRHSESTEGCLPWTLFTTFGADAVELTPWRTPAHGELPIAGATRCVMAPVHVAARHVRFEHGPRGTIVASVGAPGASARLGLVALALHRNGNSFRPVRELACSATGGRIGVGEDFGGIVAVVQGQGAQRIVLDAAQVWNGERYGRPLGDEWTRIRTALQMPGHTQRWPTRSRAGLGHLERLARCHLGAGEVRAAIESRPMALARWLVLRALGARLAWTPELWARLSEGTFEGAFEGLYPGLLPLIARLSRPRRTEWLFANRKHSRLDDVVTWAGDVDPAGLSLAADLVELRARLARAATLVRPDCAVAAELAAIRDRVERAPATLDAPPTDVVRHLLERVEREAARPVPDLDGEEPIAVDVWRSWAKARQARDAWRTAACQAVRFCERGVWDDAGSDGTTIALGDAAKGLADLTGLIERVEGGEDGADAVRLRRAAEAVIESAAAEADVSLRRAVIEAVHQRVLGKERLWQSLWQTLRDASLRCGVYPGLATLFRLDESWVALPPLQRFPAAASFAQASIELEVGVANYLAAHPHPLVAPAERLRGVLALTEPELLTAARRLGECLFARLDGNDVEPPPPLPDGPIAASLPACREWWQAVLRYERHIAGLLRRSQMLDEKVAWIRRRAAGAPGGGAHPLLEMLRDESRRLTFKELQQLSRLWGETP